VQRKSVTLGSDLNQEIEDESEMISSENKDYITEMGG
jgi:hypothetical protein